MDLAENWWHSTLLSYASLADASPIIEACLNNERLLGAEALLLAIACAENAREVRPDVRERLDKIL